MQQLKLTAIILAAGIFTLGLVWIFNLIGLFSILPCSEKGTSPLAWWGIVGMNIGLVGLTYYTLKLLICQFLIAFEQHLDDHWFDLTIQMANATEQARINSHEPRRN
jgi:hypothetical protein